MISAGNGNNGIQAQSSQSGGVAQPGSLFATPEVSFPTVPMGGGNSTTTKVGVKLDSAEGKEYLEKQQKYGLVNDIGAAVLNTMSSAFQYSLASQSMGYQADLASKYYETQTTIAGYQKEVAMEQMFVQMAAVEAQREIAKIDGDTAVALKKYEAKADADIARIQEDGKNKRCEKMAAAGQFGSKAEDPFSRGSYYHG